MTKITQADRDAATNLQTRPGPSSYIPLDVLSEAFAAHREVA